MPTSFAMKACFKFIGCCYEAGTVLSSEETLSPCPGLAFLSSIDKSHASTRWGGGRRGKEEEKTKQLKADLQSKSGDIFFVVGIKSKFSERLRSIQSTVTSHLFWDLSSFFHDDEMVAIPVGCRVMHTTLCACLINNTQKCILKVWVVKILETDTLAFEVV